MQTSELEIRSLFSCDADQVRTMDEASGFCLEQWLDDDEYSWGILYQNKLIGYCSVGGADDVGKDITDDPDYNSYDSLLLSDVYVDPEYRHQGVGTYMLSKVLSKVQSECITVYCCPSSYDLESFYGGVGFVLTDTSDSLCITMKRRPK